MKVRDIIKMIKADGWYLVATKGSHCQYKQPTEVLAPGTLNSNFKASATEGKKMVRVYRFLVVIEKTDENYLAIVGDAK